MQEEMVLPITTNEAIGNLVKKWEDTSRAPMIALNAGFTAGFNIGGEYLFTDEYLNVGGE